MKTVKRCGALKVVDDLEPRIGVREIASVFHNSYNLAGRVVKEWIEENVLTNAVPIYISRCRKEGI